MERHVVEGGEGEENARVADDVRIEEENVFWLFCGWRAFGVVGSIGLAVWCAILLLRCCCHCLLASSDARRAVHLGVPLVLEA